MKCDEDTGSPGCHDVMVERLRYFTGRHMSARDFRDADAYHRSFRHLHNRVLHGWGVACGLDVVRHPRPECRSDRVVVRCGLAIDCCGREILVRHDVVTRPIPWDERPRVGGTDSPDLTYVLLLCLEYCDTLIEKGPVLFSPEACSRPSMEFGRIREGYELCWRWVRPDDLDQYGWGLPGGCAPPEVTPDGPDQGPPGKDASPTDQMAPPQPEGGVPCPDDATPGPCCLEPACPPHHCVPLAVILAKRREDMDAQDDIDTAGRRTVAHAPEQLTRICWINWPHGGVVKASALRSLKVRFERPLLPSEHPTRPGPRGINERTFVVEYGEQLEDRQMEDLDFVEYGRPPYLASDRRTAVYEIRKPLTYRSHILQVTLRCDFIVDCHGHAVDGDHLCGRLPSGNGTPGGTFESWFRVVDDDEYARIAQTSAAAPTAATQERKP
jgi:hypothetical protein